MNASQENMSRCLSTSQAARVLGICDNTLRSKIKKGELEAVKISRSKIRITHEAINRYIESKAVGRAKAE